MTDHSLSAEQLHFAWDDSLSPTLEIDPGDTVTIETWDAGGHTLTRHSTSADMKPRPAKGHALTGPIAIHGAGPGDTLVIDILEVKPNSWGYTSFVPGRGLLPDDFTAAYLRIWEMDGRVARGVPGATVPLAPFCGVMGVALAIVLAIAVAVVLELLHLVVAVSSGRSVRCIASAS